MSTSTDQSRFENLRAQAEILDGEDELRHLRDEFHIPTKAEIKRKTLEQQPQQQEQQQKDRNDPALADETTTPCTYLCGNSLGLQPKRTATRINQYLQTWSTQGVQGHFKPLDDSPLPTWLDADARAAKLMSPIVGADESEVAVMQTLTANLHLLMSAFYRPDPKGRHKIILESKAFPSDHYAVLSQIRHHGLSPNTSMVTIESPYSEDNLITTYDIQSIISKHASDTALILLPGIQYYTGQLLDIPTITAFAHKHDIFVIWDLAHAVGNVPLSLHDWDVDAAAWCTYKYLNGGPGCIGGMFINSRNSLVTTTLTDEQPERGYGKRLSGWWGNDKGTRFQMDPRFHPVKGAAGFQLSNPSILDITSLSASLEVIELAGGVSTLREKSKKLTAFLEHSISFLSEDAKQLFRVITPSDPEQRGAQLSILLADNLLHPVMKEFQKSGVIVDERQPNVVRVAPAPLYNSFADCVAFAEAFEAALIASQDAL
ncbi:kynureninase [Hypoxylon trugodes]|uniref:kynureninase n=1 Tax=Hypoxylon trugodes TaxID=326681 RepID=UPI0021959DED|nr:kynureninase [Hypoxylon trugodes]KAI1384517.1 kynureninase [Hypoxylon trugodes]